MELILVGGCFLFGLVFGSFGNVVIARVPEGRSVVRPRSACPGCGAAIAAHDNIPVLSWVVLRGRCRSCAETIPWRYPAVELATGMLFAAVALRFGLDPALPAFLLFTWVLVVVSVIDARTRRIPNRLTYPLTPVLLGLLLVAALIEGTPWLAVRALLGGFAAFAGLLLLVFINPQGMGMGDVKLAGFLGVGLGYLGWGHVALGLFTGFLLGGLSAIALLALKLRTGKDLIPFGPYLATGALLTVLLGRPVIDAYLRFVGF